MLDHSPRVRRYASAYEKTVSEASAKNNDETRAPSGYAIVGDTLVPAAGHFAHELRRDPIAHCDIEGEQQILFV
jgi:tRNA(Arg) A34 adenosine deaminase TadA